VVGRGAEGHPGDEGHGGDRCYRVIHGDHRIEACQAAPPALAAAARTIGAAQIQTAGRSVGNLANASPAGERWPVLLAYVVVVTDRRSIPIDSSSPATGRPCAAGRRADHRGPISPGPGGRVPQSRNARRAGDLEIVMAVSRNPARIAIGSVAEVPLRARARRGCARARRPRGTVLAVAEDIRPIDDVRSTAAYRRTVTQNVLRELLESAHRSPRT